jgi:hypothetical protein
MTTNNKYEPIDDLRHLSTSAASLAIVLGFGDEEIGKCSIDDLINRTRQVFSYKNIQSEECSEIVKKHHLYITRAARRYWNSIQIARHAAKNE